MDLRPIHVTKNEENEKFKVEVHFDYKLGHKDYKVQVETAWPKPGNSDNLPNKPFLEVIVNTDLVYQLQLYDAIDCASSSFKINGKTLKVKMVKKPGWESQASWIEPGICSADIFRPLDGNRDRLRQK